jgi:hypothetical protein
MSLNREIHGEGHLDRYAGDSRRRKRPANERHASFQFLHLALKNPMTTSDAVAGLYTNTAVAPATAASNVDVCRKLAAADGRTIPFDPGFSFEDLRIGSKRRRTEARSRLIAAAHAASLPFEHLYVAKLRAFSEDPTDMVFIVRGLEEAGLWIRSADGYVSGQGYLTAFDPALASSMPMIVGPGRMFCRGAYWAAGVDGLMDR